MKILIIGATGLIGRKLAQELASAGHEVTGLSRNPGLSGQRPGPGIILSYWDGKSPEVLKDILYNQNGIINLAGESIAGGLWTERRKKILVSSRVGVGNILSEVILGMENKPLFLIQGSASGYYGKWAESIPDENAPKGEGFLADLTSRWELSVSMLEAAGVRTVFIRTGVVLDKAGGMLKQLILPFKYYGGTTPGSGRQWVSWIHIEDQVRAICFLVANPGSHGPYNLVSPAPVTMMELVREISKATGRPAWMKIPGGILKLALGEMASETILSSQRILPFKLQNEGFIFKYPSADQAIQSLLSKSRK